MAARLLVAFALLALSFDIRSDDPDSFVVHEWGTFTSVQGADGAQLTWAPLLDTELPSFVYRSFIDNGGLGGPALLAGQNKGRLSATLRMETPVIYFYTEKQLEVDVRVLFPEGLITEWYPQASQVGPYVSDDRDRIADSQRSLIEWNDVHVLARGTNEITSTALIRDRKSSRADHYYAARETDANFVRVSTARNGIEYDRNLFYRGVGYLDAPLIVSMSNDERILTLATNSIEPMVHLFVVTVQRGLMRYQKVEQVARTMSTEVDLNLEGFGAHRDVSVQLMRDVAAALVQEGLYESEARAMVETWKDQWFAENGTRVLYVLPRAWTDRNLPLEISPAPHTLVRVMVGRSEVITPTQERELERHILSYATGDSIAKQRATQAARDLQLGRFIVPAAQLALGPKPAEALWRAAERLTFEVHASDEQNTQLVQAAH